MPVFACAVGGEEMHRWMDTSLLSLFSFSYRFFYGRFPSSEPVYTPWITIAPFSMPALLADATEMKRMIRRNLSDEYCRKLDGYCDESHLQWGHVRINRIVRHEKVSTWLWKVTKQVHFVFWRLLSLLVVCCCFQLFGCLSKPSEFLTKFVCVKKHVSNA